MKIKSTIFALACLLNFNCENSYVNGISDNNAQKITYAVNVEDTFHTGVFINSFFVKGNYFETLKKYKIDTFLKYAGLFGRDFDLFDRILNLSIFNGSLSFLKKTLNTTSLLHLLNDWHLTFAPDFDKFDKLEKITYNNEDYIKCSDLSDITSNFDHVKVVDINGTKCVSLETAYGLDGGHHFFKFGIPNLLLMRNFIPNILKHSAEKTVSLLSTAVVVNKHSEFLNSANSMIFGSILFGLRLFNSLIHPDYNIKNYPDDGKNEKPSEFEVRVSSPVTDTFASYTMSTAMYSMWKTNIKNIKDMLSNGVSSDGVIFALHTLAYTAKCVYYGLFDKYMIASIAATFLYNRHKTTINYYLQPSYEKYVAPFINKASNSINYYLRKFNSKAIYSMVAIMFLLPFYDNELPRMLQKSSN